ncbi:hypothetical protein [Haloferula sp.]|uniref:hypothetical protein n=1 Tax=Haloferula sp. TaxID=2497595 RepID=UPI003C757602
MQKIAQAAGLDAFGSVESLSYTFNADLGEKKFIRSWTWLPGSNDVTLHGESTAQDISYQRGQIASSEDADLTKIDQQFVNDLYWLIFPFQVVWDPSVSVEALPKAAAAVVPDAPAGLRVRYPAGMGYTPGDVYDLFYDKDHKVTHWVFRKGGSAEPSRVSEWKDYKDFNGLSISLNRPSPDDSVRIWFEDVTVKGAE